jgi:alpha-D-ribose 1-methylphosphonate 5-triphosphate synthase subunit PhnH
MTGLADFATLEPGFDDPVRGSQAAFRAVLDAMAHPGRIVALPGLLGGAPPAPLSAAAAAIALTLCDIDTPVWLDAAASSAAGYLAFHCGAPLVANPAHARFAIIADTLALRPLDGFALGSDEFPERSATLVIEVADLSYEGGEVLRGPGIRGETRLDVTGLPARFWEERAALAELFPRGIDVVFTSGTRLAALPRSTQVIS